jgi:uncharacterized OB-fold protein
MTEKTLDERPPRPTPVPDGLSAPYWQAARQGRLVIQRCQACGTYHHPPLTMCTQCQSENLGYEPVSGKGTIYTSTITHDARTPAFAARQPYAIVWVELDEQPRLRVLTNMPDTPLDQVKIGAKVEVTFEEIAPDVTIPQFTLISQDG